VQPVVRIGDRSQLSLSRFLDGRILTESLIEP
jgi:hypothetical protein